MKDVKNSNRWSLIAITVLLWFLLEPPFRIYVVGQVSPLVNLSLSALTIALIYSVLVLIGWPHRAFTRVEWIVYAGVLVATIYVLGD